MFKLLATASIFGLLSLALGISQAGAQGTQSAKAKCTMWVDQDLRTDEIANSFRQKGYHTKSKDFVSGAEYANAIHGRDMGFLFSRDTQTFKLLVRGSQNKLYEVELSYYLKGFPKAGSLDEFVAAMPTCGAFQKLQIKIQMQARMRELGVRLNKARTGQMNGELWGHMFLDLEFAMVKQPRSEYELKKYKDDYSMFLASFADLRGKDLLANIDDFRQRLISLKVRNYCNPKVEGEPGPLLGDFFGPNFCGNCVAQTVLAISLIHDLELQVREPYVLGVQYFTDHMRPVLHNKTEKSDFDIIYGKTDYVDAFTLTDKGLIWKAMNLVQDQNSTSLSGFSEAASLAARREMNLTVGTLTNLKNSAYLWTDGADAHNTDSAFLHSLQPRSVAFANGEPPEAATIDFAQSNFNAKNFVQANLSEGSAGKAKEVKADDLKWLDSDYIRRIKERAITAKLIEPELKALEKALQNSDKRQLLEQTLGILNPSNDQCYFRRPSVSVVPFDSAFAGRKATDWAPSALELANYHLEPNAMQSFMKLSNIDRLKQVEAFQRKYFSGLSHSINVQAALRFMNKPDWRQLNDENYSVAEGFSELSSAVSIGLRIEGFLRLPNQIDPSSGALEKCATRFGISTLYGFRLPEKLSVELTRALVAFANHTRNHAGEIVQFYDRKISAQEEIALTYIFEHTSQLLSFLRYAKNFEESRQLLFAQAQDSWPFAERDIGLLDSALNPALTMFLRLMEDKNIRYLPGDPKEESLVEKKPRAKSQPSMLDFPNGIEVNLISAEEFEKLVPTPQPEQRRLVTVNKHLARALLKASRGTTEMEQHPVYQVAAFEWYRKLEGVSEKSPLVPSLELINATASWNKSSPVLQSYFQSYRDDTNEYHGSTPFEVIGLPLDRQRKEGLPNLAPLADVRPMLKPYIAGVDLERNRYCLEFDRRIYCHVTGVYPMVDDGTVFAESVTVLPDSMRSSTYLKVRTGGGNKGYYYFAEESDSENTTVLRKSN